ncbi:DUF945 family protein [Alteromonas sp. H39]|uniref:DUF945 family protein n=1 Tax=Alteromonas sp. H39 TaxID=3389876 RepID=UPI0039DFDC51
MRITSVAIAVGVVVAVGAAATWYTKNQYNEAIANQLAKATTYYDDIGMEVTRDVTQSSFFSLSDKITITATQAMFEKMDTGYRPSEPATFSMLSDCSVLPLYVTCDSVFELGTDELSLMLSEITKGFNYSLKSSVNALTSSIHYTFVSDALTREEDGVLVNIKPIRLTSESDLSMSEAELEGSWDGLTLEKAASQEKITVGEMEMKLDIEYLEDLLYTGDTELTLSSFDLSNAAAGSTLAAEKINFSTTTWQRDDSTFGVNYNVTGDSVTATGEMPLDVKDIVLKFQLEGMSQAAMKYLIGYNNSAADMQNPEAVAKMIDILGENPLSMTIDDISAVYNDAEIELEGKFDLQRFDMGILQSGQMPGRVSGTLNIELDEKAPQVLPALVPMLNQYVQMQMVEVDEEGDFSSTITIKDRKVTANGQLVTEL